MQTLSLRVLAWIVLPQSRYFKGSCRRSEKRAFDERFKEIIAQHNRNTHQFCLLMIDLDKFKDVNDKHGHPAGNEVLIEIAKRFNGLLREYDFVARYGGDEFVMILPDTNSDDACKAAFRIIEEISKSMIVKNGSEHEVEVGATIGVAEYKGKSKDPNGEMMIQSADDSLLYLKNNDRRGRVARNKEEVISKKERHSIEKRILIDKVSENITQETRGELIQMTR